MIVSVVYTDGEGNITHRDGNNLAHRLDGPAFIAANGGREWWVEGRLHRSDGPAVMWADGVLEWWHRGRRMDIYYPNFGCAVDFIKTREQALARLNAKPRPYSYPLYLADIDKLAQGDEPNTKGEGSHHA
jgi:hypothetical protein